VTDKVIRTATMIRLFKHYIPHAVLLLGLLDIALLAGATELAWQLRAQQIAMNSGLFADRWLAVVTTALVIWLAMVAVGVYGPKALRSLRFAGARLLVATSLGIMALVVIDLVLPTGVLWRSTLLYTMCLAIAVLVGDRMLLNSFLGSWAFRRRVMVLGAGDRAQRLRELAELPESGFVIVSYIAMSDDQRVVEEAISRGAIHDLGKFVENLGVSEVVLALQERRNSLPLKDLLRIKTKGVHVNDFSSFIERETGRVDLETVNPSWLIFSDGFSSGRMLSSAVKRMFDITASLALLLLTFPVIAIFALIVKLDSQGPAFFRQQRIGLYGEPFPLIKLRSMRTDAEKDGAKWAEENDPRITRVGRLIRQLRIDELPQTWSVLLGHMSFVGPRPEVPSFVEDLEEDIPFYGERHMVKPGITGWAQINYPYGASNEDARSKLEYDLYYAKNYTPFLDLVILLQTVRVILWPEGAR
jgi:sugar transferase (PEP-CTERM system associated)